MEITPELFEKQRSRRFGNANPEKMQFAFWEWMVRGGEGPYRVRELFQMPVNREDSPIWTFNRMGVTRTELPDGRMISIGGEYEDYYDPEFCIYNDVVVQGPAGGVEIYGYPADVFPPTRMELSKFGAARLSRQMATRNVIAEISMITH